MGEKGEGSGGGGGGKWGGGGKGEGTWNGVPPVHPLIRESGNIFKRQF